MYMWQMDGEKECVLTWGDLIGGRKQSKKPIVTTNYEKSAEVILAIRLKTNREGLNFRR